MISIKMRIYDQKNKVNVTIIKANSFLLKKYKNNFDELKTNDEKFMFLKCLWKKEFGASFYKRSIKFNNQYQQMMFSIKFNS